MESMASEDKRKYPRSSLDLPLEYRMRGLSYGHGGIAVNGSEGGFLIRCPRDIAVGAELRISVLFPKEFALVGFEASTEILRKDDRWDEEIGYYYAVRLTRVSEEDRLKLRYVLNSMHESANAEGSSANESANNPLLRRKTSQSCLPR